MYASEEKKRKFLIAGSVLLSCGALFVFIGGYIGFVTLERYIEKQIIANVVLKEGNMQFDRFYVVPFPINYKMNFFNVSNPEEVLAGGIPIVQEVGPYIYNQYRYNDIVGLEPDRLEFYERMWIEYDEEKSGTLRDTDVVTIVNVPFFAVLHILEQDFPAFTGVVNALLTNIFGVHNQPIMQASVKEFIVDGLTLCANPGILGAAVCAVIRAIAANNPNMEVNPDNSIKFAMFLPQMNGTGEWFKIKRGIENIHDLGDIVEWQGSTTLTQWTNPIEGETSVCNMINGTNTIIYSPFRDRSEQLDVFVADVCRSSYAIYSEDIDFKGITGFRYIVGDYLFSNSEGCFCINKTRGINDDNGCLYYGAMELYNCIGAHLVATSPHFLNAHPIYQNGVIGLNPDPEKHAIYLDLEPYTGVPLNGSKRAQFNVFIKPFEGIPVTDTLSTTLMPILWLEDTVELPDDYVNMLRTMMFIPMKALEVLRILAIVLGGIMVIVGIVLLILSINRKKEKGQIN